MRNRLGFIVLATACLSATRTEHSRAQEQLVEISLEKQAPQKAATIFVDQPVSALFIKTICQSLEESGYEIIQLESARDPNIISPERSRKTINFRVHLANEKKLTLTLAPLLGTDLMSPLLKAFSGAFRIEGVRLKDFPKPGQRFNTLEFLKAEM